MNTPSINLDYRPMICGCCFAVSLDGVVLCCSRNPVKDSARVLKKMGVMDDAIITLRSEESFSVDIAYTLSSALNGTIRDVSETDSTPTKAVVSDVEETDDIRSEGMASEANEAGSNPKKLH